MYGGTDHPDKYVGFADDLVEKMHDLVEENESSGWKVFRVHRSSGWITSGLLRDCLRWSERCVSQVSIWNNVVCCSDMLAQYKIKWTGKVVSKVKRVNAQSRHFEIAENICIYFLHIYIYIYIYRERERERYIDWVCYVFAIVEGWLVGSSPNREISSESLTQAFRWRELDLVKGVLHDVLIRGQDVLKFSSKTQVARLKLLS